MNQERPVLYINILVHDASEAVKDELAAKVKKSRIPYQLLEPMTNRAASLIRFSTVVVKMGKRLCEEIPVKMRKKGIQVHVENVFTEANYLVLELQVQHVDAVVMSEVRSNQSNDDNAGTLFFKGMFSVIGVKNRDSLERELLPAILQRKVSVSIREMMREKLTEKKMTADVEIRQEERQARYFFQTLRLLRETCPATDNTGKSSPSSCTPTSKASTNSAEPPTHVKKRSMTDSLTSVVEAAMGSVSTTSSKKGQRTAKASKKESTKAVQEKKGHRRSHSLASTVEAAAASVVASVKKGASMNSAVRTEKEAAYSATVAMRSRSNHF